MKQKPMLIDYRSQLKDCEKSSDVLDGLQSMKKQWRALHGVVELHFDAGGGVAHLIVTNVSPELMALVHEAADQSPDVYYVTDKEITPGRTLAMKEELIECISGPDISDAEVETLYEILAGKEKSNDTCH